MKTTLLRFSLAALVLTLSARADEIQINDLTDTLSLNVILSAGTAHGTVSNLNINNTTETLTFDYTLPTGVWGTGNVYRRLFGSGIDESRGTVSDIFQLTVDATNAAVAHITFVSDPGTLAPVGFNLGDIIENGTFQHVLDTSGIVNPLDFEVASDVTTVPEPSSLTGCAILLAGLGFGLFARRRMVT